MSVPGTVSQQEVSESVKILKRTPGKLRGVVESSGVCGWFVLSPLYNSTSIISFLETTPGVYQASGYGDLTETESIWCKCFILLRSAVCPMTPISRFWLAARKNPDTASLMLWFNGGVCYSLN